MLVSNEFKKKNSLHSVLSCCLDDEDSYFAAPNMVAVYSLATVLPPTGLHPVVIQNTVIPRLTKIIRSGITFVSRNVMLSGVSLSRT